MLADKYLIVFLRSQQLPVTDEFLFEKNSVSENMRQKIYRYVLVANAIK